MRSLGLVGLFEYVCALSQNWSNKIYLFSFENIQNSPPNPAISWFHNEIQMTRLFISLFLCTLQSYFKIPHSASTYMCITFVLYYLLQFQITGETSECRFECTTYWRRNGWGDYGSRWFRESYRNHWAQTKKIPQSYHCLCAFAGKNKFGLFEKKTRN